MWPVRLREWIRGLGERGAALVELSILAPFLVVLTFGAIEFGRFLYNYQLILTGVRDAGRYLARVADPTLAANQTNAQNLAATGDIGGGTNRVAWWDPADVAFAFPVRAATDTGGGAVALRDGGGNATIVLVTSTVNYQDFGLLEILGITPIAFTVTHEQRFIGD